MFRIKCCCCWCPPLIIIIVLDVDVFDQTKMTYFDLTLSQNPIVQTTLLFSLVILLLRYSSKPYYGASTNQGKTIHRYLWILSVNYPQMSIVVYGWSNGENKKNKITSKSKMLLKIFLFEEKINFMTVQILSFSLSDLSSKTAGIQ